MAGHILVLPLAEQPRSLQRSLPPFAERLARIAQPERHFVKEEVFRLPAYVAGLASLALIAVFLRRLGYWLPGIFAAWLLALHPWMLRYTTEGRGYALMLALIPLTLTLLVRALHRGSWGRWLAYGASQFLLLYTFPAGVYLLLIANAIAALALWRLHRGTPVLRQQVPRWLVVNLAGSMAWGQLMLPNMMQLLEYFRTEFPDTPPRFLANLLGSLWVGLSWRVGSEGEFYPELIDMALAHPTAFRVGLAATLSLVAAGFLRLLAAGGVRALLSLVLLVPGPLAYWIAMVREDRVHEWYFLFALPGLVALFALGLGWLFAWIRRPRLSTALTAVTMVVVLGSYAVWTRLPREVLRSGSLQPLRESVLLTRGTLDPFAPENEGIITTSFKRGPTYYDPLLIEIETVAEMRKLMRRGRPDRGGSVREPRQAGTGCAGVPGPVRVGGAPCVLRGGDDALRVRAPGSSHHLPLSRGGGRMNDARVEPDYALLDRRGLARGLFYPRRDLSRPPPGATDHRIEVEEGVEVACRFYPLDPSRPAVLFFHGNGEIASDYDGIAPAYHGIGANLWVVDYRGYGGSDGIPSFASLFADAHPVLARFHSLLDEEGFTAGRFVMGRSLGSLPAAELAATAHERLAGLIIESGAPDLARLRERAGVDASDTEVGASGRDSRSAPRGNPSSRGPSPRRVGPDHSARVWSRVSRAAHDGREAAGDHPGSRAQ